MKPVFGRERLSVVAPLLGAVACAASHNSSMTAMNARGIRAAQVGFLANALLATVKLVAGVLGNSYALVADAVESIADIFSSAIVWGGLRIASREADDEYPWGYGKAESLAAATSARMTAMSVG